MLPHTEVTNYIWQQGLSKKGQTSLTKYIDNLHFNKYPSQRSDDTNKAKKKKTKNLITNVSK